MMVQRVFVEKKPEYAVEAAEILQDLQDSLGTPQEITLRLFHCYDVENLSQDHFNQALDGIFAEAQVDITYLERLPAMKDAKIFATAYLPGQFDQRADSAAQCIGLLTGGERPTVATAKVFAFSGVDETLFGKIQEYLINPVESHRASLMKPQSLFTPQISPPDVATVQGFIFHSDEEIAAFHAQMNFAMTGADLAFCRDYFKGLDRDPTVTELRVIDTYWSDHCRHTTFSTKLSCVEMPKNASTALKKAWQDYQEARKKVYGEREKNISLMDLATIGMKLLRKEGKLNDLDVSEEINACSIQVPLLVDGQEEIWLLQFKNETHNHPTEIEPFGGAATCLGGAIRDPLSGRAYVYQAMRVTGAGDPLARFEDTLPGKLPQRKIVRGAAAGYASYGNQIGLATGQVTELYDQGYVAKRMEIGAVIGAAPKSNVRRETPAPGDVILLIGGRTGRDGCGGATGSSKAHDENSSLTCGAEVQKGNPPTERKLQRLFRKSAVARLIKRCNDFGAGGVCVAIGELADGLTINLDAVAKKYDGLDGTELAISESQERMAVVLALEDMEAFMAFAAEENLEARHVATVTKERHLRIFWHENCIADLSRDFLDTNGVTGQASALLPGTDLQQDYRQAVPKELQNIATEDAFIKNLARLNVCSQQGLSERFDATIGASSVLLPFGGKYQKTPEEGMVSKLPVQGICDDASAMTYGFIPALSQWSPFHGGAFAVMESLAKLAAVGAPIASARLTFQEYFERLHHQPERWGKPVAALLGAFSAQLGMGTPAIGGKDSMSGSFGEMSVPPTLVSFAVSMTKASHTGSAAFKGAGHGIYLLALPTDDDHMPHYGACKALFEQVSSLVASGDILAASVVKEGGAAACTAKMSFGNAIGARIYCTDPAVLFAPLVGSFVVEVAHKAILDRFEVLHLGETTAEKSFQIGGQCVPMERALLAYEGTLEPIYPMHCQEAVPMPEIPAHTQKSLHKFVCGVAKPTVFMPVFPGTNCEMDSARAFERAGAKVETLVVRNLLPQDVVETVACIAKAIKHAQIVFLPGGFSGGDEPDGSGKFIATTLRSPAIAQAIADLLEERDGLVLGICNGFQALIKMGLLPYGKITKPRAEDPTLTFNTLGRHVSHMVHTRVTSVKSPWLSLCEAGEIHCVPVSHGEGRFVAGDRLESLRENGQIATQYVDLQGNPSADLAWNVNGSVAAIEGITSPDGRVFGKMAHSERLDADCYKNVPGNKDQHLFEAGVRFFRG